MAGVRRWTPAAQGRWATAVGSPDCGDRPADGLGVEWRWPPSPPEPTDGKLYEGTTASRGSPSVACGCGGGVRVGNGRISLDLVVEQYENGVTPDDMAHAYDILVLAALYAVIAYYLRHRDEVRAYLKRRGQEAQTLRG